MNTFLKTYRLALTPLSPIHIGCGEDFEPTNYVIDDGVLYGFDPSRAVLNETQTRKLADAANKASLLAIQRFFKDHAKTFQALADVLIPVCSGVAEKYEKDIGRATNIEASGNQVFNRFIIERTISTGRLSQAYIPGSSFKGAIRTSMLDALNKEQRVMRNDDLERRLFKGEFETSPLRLVKIADLMPSYEPARRIVYAVNRKKAQIIKDGQELQPKGIAARKECILQGQYRLFTADAVLQSLDSHQDGKTTPARELRPTDFRLIAKQSNTYNLTRLRRELAVLDGRGFVNPAWKNAMESLLAGELGTKVDSGDAFLIRLGRYGGAESKTLSGEGVAQIKIMQGKGQPPIVQSETKTVWLAAEHDTDQKHLLPFGWAVVEIDPLADLPQLKAWCQAESKKHPNMVELRQSFDAEKAAALQHKADLADQAVAQAAAKLAEELACQARAVQLAAMAPQAKLIEVLRQKYEAWVVRDFKKQSADIGKAGFYKDASDLTSQALESNDWTAADRLALANMLETWLPKVIAPWEKDQRKKLKLSALKGL